MGIRHKLFDIIHRDINTDFFDLSFDNIENTYFPDYLKNCLESWFTIYSENIQESADLLTPNRNNEQNVILNRIRSLINGVNTTMLLYYEGKVKEATNHFYETMQNLFFTEIKLTYSIEINTRFYRARKNEDKIWKRNDLFHVPFEKRNFVSTNRYSIPGFPALYLGDSTYVCWEEFNKYRLRDLHFCKFENKESIKVVNIQLFSDFLNSIEHMSSEKKSEHFLRYLVAFPLIIACTRKVKEQQGNFKPEYIIPQLLLQYVTDNSSTINGIRFPSSKINYANLINVNAYNYVFPVRSNEITGYCKTLSKIFYATEPTSLELEEIGYNPMYQSAMATTFDSTEPKEKIRLTESEYFSYINTSFGKLESILNRRQTLPI